VVANVVAAFMLVAAGAVYGWVRYRLDAIHTVAAKTLTPDGRDSAHGLPPENILLIGNQSRACLTTQAQIAQFGNPAELSGSLSDVIMIAHLDPKTGSASILSIPRDLFEAMPTGTLSGPYEKIDAALNEGANGPANLIAAIQNDLGIPINHYVEVNFCGFQQTVNALGGIRMDFPERLYDLEASLNVTQPGCQTINGATALALVRSRHLQYDPPGDTAPAADWPSDPESDLSRIIRDHEFVKALIDAAESQGVYNPFKLNSFLSAVTSQVTMDPGLRNQLINLASTYRHLAAGNLPETTLPVTPYPNYVYDGYHLGDVDFAVEPQDDQVIRAWDAGALPQPVAPTSIQVFNAVGLAHLAADTGTALTADGLRVTTEADTSIVANPSETLVRYSPGQVAQGVAVLGRFAGAVTMQPDPQVPLGAVWVDVGTSETVTSPAPPTTAASSPATGQSSAPAAPTTTVPTIGGVAPSASANPLTAYDPTPC